MTNRVIFPSMVAGESALLRFDFISRLPQGGAVIDSAEASAIVYSGTDGSADDIIVDPTPTPSDETWVDVMVLPPVGQAEGNIYLLSCSVVVDTETLIMEGLVAVLP